MMTSEVHAAIDPNAHLTSGILEITPEMAARWLEGNVRNRKVDQKHVDQLAEEIKAGRWKTTHQGIAFDTAGTLQDGQHRLWAILQADRPVRMIVFFNVSPDNVDVMDGVKPRTILDRMNLSREFGTDGADPRELATLREMLRSTMDPDNLPYGKVSGLLKRHRAAIQFAIKHLGSHVRGIGVCYVRAVIARAWYCLPPNQLAAFCRMLRSGLIDGPEDTVIIRLRDLLIGSTPVRGVNAQRQMYGKVEQALIAWLRGENRKVLRGMQYEHFMLPEDAEAIAQERAAG